MVGSSWRGQQYKQSQYSSFSSGVKRLRLDDRVTGACYHLGHEDDYRCQRIDFVLNRWRVGLPRGLVGCSSGGGRLACSHLRLLCQARLHHEGSESYELECPVVEVEVEHPPSKGRAAPRYDLDRLLDLYCGGKRGRGCRVACLCLDPARLLFRATGC